MHLRRSIALLSLTLAGCHAVPIATSTAPLPAPAPSAPASAAAPPGALPAAAPDAPTAAVLPHETFTIDSKVLGETRRINVYTPPGYASSPEAHFTILYMPDGGVSEDFPHVIATVNAGIRAGELRPLIVVGIENTQRRRDMTGPTTVAKDRTIAPHVGGSAPFRAFLRDELMPEVNRRVRGNGKTAIIGESLAGLFIVETFFLEPRLFDTYIALSPSLWWNDQALARRADTWLKKETGLTSTLYLTAAGDDILQPIESLATSLKGNAPHGLTWFYEPMPQEHHSTIYLAASPGALRRLFPPVAAGK